MIIETSKCEYMQIILTETIQLSIGVQTWTEKYISVCTLHTGLIILRTGSWVENKEVKLIIYRVQLSLRSYETMSV